MNRIKLFSLFAVALMMVSGIVVMSETESSDAATSSWSPNYTYTLTLNSTTDTTSPLTVTLGGDLAGKQTITAGDAGDFNFDSTGHGPFYSFYGLFDNDGAYLGQLDPYNLAQFMDGTTAPITTNNVMWVLPTVYWSISQDGMTLTLSSDPSNGTAYAHTIDGLVWEYLAIGVYEGTSTGTYNSASSQGEDSFMSSSGKSPRVSAMREVMRSEAAGTFDDDNGYKFLWNFYQWQLYRFAVLATTGTFYEQSIFGVGVVGGAGLSAGSQTGKLDAVGPYSNTGSAASAQGAKAFIENAWGSIFDFVDDCVWYPEGTTNDLYLGQNDASKILDKYKSDAANKNSENAKTNKTVQYQVTTAASGQASGVTVVNPIMWGFPSVANGLGTTGTTAYFGVPGPSDSYARLVYVGGYYNASVDDAGLACAYAYSLGSAYADCGSRLAFVYGDSLSPPTPATITITADSEYGTVSPSTANVMVGDIIAIENNIMTIGSATITATPATDTAQYDYSFLGFYEGDTQLQTGDTVTGNMTITAKFAQFLNQYTVTIQPNDPSYGSVSQSSLTVDYGTTISASGSTLTIGSDTVTPTASETTAQYTFAFSEWSGIPTGGTITEDVTITADFTATVNTYTVTIQSNNTDKGTVDVTTITDVPYGETISITKNKLIINGTTVTATAASGYELDKWSVGNGYVITGDTTITASFDEPSSTEKTMLKLVPLIVILGLVMFAAVAMMRFTGNGYDLVKMLIGLAICVMFVAAAMIPAVGGL